MLIKSLPVLFFLALMLYFFMAILNYVVLKAYFILLMKNKYRKEWTEIGSPNFFDSMENAENILSLLNDIEGGHPLKKRIWLYSLSFKLMNVGLWSGLILLVLIKIAEYIFDVDFGY